MLKFPLEDLMKAVSFLPRKMHIYTGYFPRGRSAYLGGRRVREQERVC